MCFLLFYGFWKFAYWSCHILTDQFSFNNIWPKYNPDLHFSGLEEFSTDKSKCQEHFDVYKECKKKEVLHFLSTFHMLFFIVPFCFFPQTSSLQHLILPNKGKKVRGIEPALNCASHVVIILFACVVSTEGSSVGTQQKQVLLLMNSFQEILLHYTLPQLVTG